jgi:RimJ/RimL family protein N-acetyltransferase
VIFPVAQSSPMSEVRLRDARPADVPALDRLLTPAGGGEFNDFGERRKRSVAEPVASGTISSPDRGLLVVELVPERRVIGMVTWNPVMHGPNPESRCWNVGIALLPEDRGRGWGGPAQLAVARHLFANTDANRVEASADVDNAREHRALEKAGFAREGVLRGAQFRGGRWRDLVLFSLLRTDPAAEP